MRAKTVIFLILLSFSITALFCEEPQVLRILVDGKWGAINSDGDIILEPKYDYLYPFHSGASVLYNGDYFEAKRAYIDKNGNVAIEHLGAY